MNYYHLENNNLLYDLRYFEIPHFYDYYTIKINLEILNNKKHKKILTTGEKLNYIEILERLIDNINIKKNINFDDFNNSLETDLKLIAIHKKTKKKYIVNFKNSPNIDIILENDYENLGFYKTLKVTFKRSEYEIYDSKFYIEFFTFRNNKYMFSINENVEFYYKLCDSNIYINNKEYKKINCDELKLEAQKYLYKPNNVMYYINKYGFDNFEYYM